MIFQISCDEYFQFSLVRKFDFPGWKAAAARRDMRSFRKRAFVVKTCVRTFSPFAASIFALGFEGRLSTRVWKTHHVRALFRTRSLLHIQQYACVCASVALSAVEHFICVVETVTLRAVKFR